MHEQRLSYKEASPEAFKALHTEMQVHKTGIEESLLELVKMRASQINGCGYCLDMHSKDAVAQGESLQRLVLLSAWREAPNFYTERERAALAWTDALTRLSQGHTQKTAREALDEHFTAEEQMNLTVMINVINGWNRLVVGFNLYAPELGWK